MTYHKEVPPQLRTEAHDLELNGSSLVFPLDYVTLMERGNSDIFRSPRFGKEWT